MTATRSRIAARTIVASVAVIGWLPRALPAQQPAATDTLHLPALERAAIAADPRGAQLALQRARTALRLRSLAAERLPALDVDGQGQYQSAVTSVPLHLPNLGIPTPPHDTYDAYLRAQERLFDPTLAPRRDVERAQLAANEAQVRATLYGLRQQVDDAFFTAVSLESRIAALNAAIADLRAQLAVTRERVRAGTALQGEADAIEAQTLARGEDVRAAAADRDAALTVLGDLTGRAISTATVLALPAVDSTVPTPATTSLRQRPEYAAFARTRDLLRAQEAVVAAQDKPRISAFGRLGYGRPGLNMLSDSFQSYWLAGVQVQWTPWTWGSNARDREALEVQRRITTTEEAAFTASVRRAVVRDSATVTRLAGTLATDERIIALREQGLAEARAQFREGVITAAQFVDRETDLLQAHLDQASHRVELARARAALATITGTGGDE